MIQEPLKVEMRSLLLLTRGIKDQVSCSCKRKEIENSTTHNLGASVITMAPCVTDLPVTFAVPLQYIDNL